MDSKKKLSKTVRFECLDSYRGILAYLVIFDHAANYYKLANDYQVFSEMGYFVSVIGFFTLSAFLLTYRLLKDFNESRKKAEELFVVIKYFLRRFFRIYLSFAIFCAAIKIPEYGRLIGGIYGHYNSFLKLITLQRYLTDHLWSIAPEIKYYFFIPLITYLTKKAGKLWMIPWAISFMTTFLISYYNPFKFSESDFKLHSGFLHPRFSAFFCGSLIAIAYYYIEKEERIMKYRNNRIVHYIILIMTIVIVIFGIKYFSPFFNKRLSRVKHTFFAGLCWSSFIFLMLVGSPNYLTNLLSESSVLKLCGKFSFGIYLLNPAILLYFETIRFSTSFELLFYISMCSFASGFLFFYGVENNLMKIAEMLIRNVSKELNIRKRFT